MKNSSYIFINKDLHGKLLSEKEARIEMLEKSVYAFYVCLYTNTQK
jgi:hypothetical protein